MSKHAILILSHSDISHIYTYANIFPEYNFYIHQDIKFPITNIIPSENNNLFLLPKELSYSVNWGSFSQIEATNSLLRYALKNDDNEFFHLISGSDLVLGNIKELLFNKDIIYMECFDSIDHRYRVRLFAPHANTKHQRMLHGKIYTKFLKVVDRLIPSSEKYYFGSSWFSISRSYLKIIMNSIDSEFNIFFRKKLCPDEHYYQYLVYKNNLQSHLSKTGNRRFIIFDKNYNNGNNPVFLNINDINNIDKNKYWFARKVTPETINSYLKIAGFK